MTTSTHPAQAGPPSARSPRTSLSGVRARLLVLVLLAMLPALGLTVYRAFEDRRAATSRAEADALGAARAAARTQAQLVQQAHQLLLGLAQLPAVREAPSEPCARLLARIVSEFRVYANLGVADRDGDVVCSGVPLPGSVNVADRDYFERAVASRELVVGEYIVGRITGLASLPVAFPLVERGRVRGAVFASLDLRWLDQVLSNRSLPDGSTVTVLDRRGTILARVPDRERWVGRTLPEAQLVQAVRSARTGVVTTGGLDGVSRFYGVVPLVRADNEPDVFVTVGIPTEAALAAATRTLVRDLLVLALVALVALGLALAAAHVFLVRPVDRLTAATRRLGAGTPDARVRLEHAPRELVELGSAFNQMAESLGRREAELRSLNDDLERRVAERTAELEAANDGLAREAAIRTAVLDAAVDGIRLVDLEGRTLVANAAIETLTSDVFGLPGDSTLAERAALAERLTDPDSYRAATDQIISNPDAETLDEFELADSGRSFQRYTAPVRDASGAPIGRIVVVREVTAERHADRLKSELVATVSHELRTPLASILGFAELLLERELTPDVRTRYLETVCSEARRLAALINDFLDLQRIEAGSFAPSLDVLDLASVLREQVEVFSAQSSVHELVLELPQEPLEVVADRERMAQVIANLLSNSIKYSPKGGRVVVRGELEGDTVHVAVRDEGVGIPPEQQAKLFTKFFRVDSSDTREIGGTGLGLALVREILQAHHGRVGLESVEGEGSTFWFELPAARRGGGGSGRVLVVEDDPAAAALMAEYLAGDGFEVEVVATGEDALERALADPPALVALDIGLAGELDGWDVLTSLKTSPQTADVPVIVCTAGDDRQHAAALGAADFLVKPFPLDRVRTAVSRLLPEGGSVLVVDDEEAIRSLVRQAFAGNGIQLSEAADGAQALEIVRSSRPDVVILDLLMPRMDGFEVLERIQDDEGTRFIPVIVLTGKELTDDERRFLRFRTFAVLEKARWSSSELRRLVSRALASSDSP